LIGLLMVAFFFACAGGEGDGGSDSSGSSPAESFAAFKQAMAQNDQQAALDQVSSAGQQKVQDMMDAAQGLGYSPAEMISGLGGLKLEEDRKEIKIYSANKTIRGKAYSFEVIYILEDGKWKILSI